MRPTISSSRAHHVALAVAHAVETRGTPTSPEVETLLRTTVHELLDAGAGADDVHRALQPLFVSLRASYERASVRVALDVLLTQMRSLALERAYLRPEAERGRDDGS